MAVGVLGFFHGALESAGMYGSGLTVSNSGLRVATEGAFPVKAAVKETRDCESHSKQCRVGYQCGYENLNRDLSLVIALTPLTKSQNLSSNPTLELALHNLHETHIHQHATLAIKAYDSISAPRLPPP